MNLCQADLFAPPSSRGRPRMDIKERLFKYRKIDKNGHWLWIGFVSKGYGQICLWTRKGRTTVSVSRLACAIWLGLDLEDHQQVSCHKNSCHESLCFNPDHLYVGTYSSNVNDRSEIGTNISPQGSDHYKAVFDEADVLKIREAYRKGERIAELARTYGVAYCTIEHMVKRQTWKHI
jgi:hypothetical protein